LTVTLNVRDSVGGTTSGTVTVVSTQSNFYLLPAGVTIPAFSSKAFQIFGGTAPFDIFVDNPIIDIFYFIDPLDPLSARSFTVIGLSAGTATVTIRDANGFTTTGTVTVQ
jgi:hypothetical protein